MGQYSLAWRGTYGKRALEGNLVLLDAINSSIGDSGLAVLENRIDVDRLPGDRRLMLC